MYFIYWKSLLTDYVSHGQCVFTSKRVVSNLVDELNTKYSGKFIHTYSHSSNYEEIINNLSKLL